MSLYTINRSSPLISGSDPLQAISQIAGGTPAPQLDAGTIVSVADPPVTTASYTQVTTESGAVGWVPTANLTQGIMSSTPVSALFGIGILVGIFFAVRAILKS